MTGKRAPCFLDSVIDGGKRCVRPPAERLVLGLGAFGHDASAAFVRGGEVLFAAEQERFDRVKHSDAFPVDAVAAGLSHLGCSFADVDDIVLNYDRWLVLGSHLVRTVRYFPRTLHMFVASSPYRFGWRMARLKRALAARFGAPARRTPWRHVDHHLAHAASAYYRSSFERAAILTCDALGERDSVLRAVGVDNRIEVIDSIPFPHSLGAVYSAVSDHLGFQIYSGEGKVMGLAGYGRPRPEFDLSPLIRLKDDGRFEVDLRFFTFQHHHTLHERWGSARFVDRYGKRRGNGEPLGDRHADLARSLQELTDRVVAHLCTHLAARAQCSSLCYAGGVALNGYANTKILRGTEISDLYIQPAANDGGTGLGAALYHSHHTLDLPRRSQSGGTFLGPAFPASRCEQVLKRSRLAYARPANLVAEVAGRLAANRVVGWYQGRMELGPRALGHRSILANPDHPRMKDYLNARIKHREPFRPFAPVVPLERANEFFDLPCRSSPFMLLIAPVRTEWRDRLPAVSHVDGTARVQTVDRADDPLLVALLEAFERRSGIPVLLNTSFNGPGEPIVCTPEDAVESFRKHGLDDLVLGNFLTDQRSRPGIETASDGSGSCGDP